MSEVDRDREADELLLQLGALEREHDEGFPHEWEDVVRGDRSAEEVAAARREAGDDPEELEALAELLRPTSDAEREAWVERAAEALGSSAPGEGTGGAETSDDAREGEATVVSLGERRRRPWVVAVVGLLAAAALLLWLRPRGGPGPEPGASTLPTFTLTVRNEVVQQIRSGDAEPVEIAQYLPGTKVRWFVSPERSVEGAVGVRIVAEPVGRPASERRLLDPPAAVSDRGVIEIRGDFDSVLVGLPPGRWSLRVVVGEPPPADLAAFDAGGPWTVVEPPYEIEVLEDAP